MAAKSDESSYKFLAGLVKLAIVGYVIWLLLPGRWTDPVKYALIYSVDDSKVTYAEKPKDCDFIHAPLGDKACHYDKIVRGYNSTGDCVAGVGAPKFSTSTLNKPIVSYDDGKSWHLIPEGEPHPDTKVVKVEIDWAKVNE